MAWCPKCKTEYESNIKKCSDCNSNLVDTIESSDEQPDHEEFLIMVNDDIQASLIESLLNSEGIPVLKKYPASSGYINIYMGISKLGVEIYVPSKLVHKAKDVIKTFE